ncbi:MAG: deoxyribose-phosphate aldolase [Verrucomicrobiota bacterium]|nr:deoxyribose-phosphate aldolase [Verrucomicrobiota bacterium]
MTPDGARVAPLIDHTLLKPAAVRREVRQLCAEARRYGFAAVCVNPCWVRTAAEELRDTPVKVCTVIGFPLGATTTAVRVFEAGEAIHNGAQELDMALCLGALKDGDHTRVQEDIAAVVLAADARPVKVIIETALLTDEEKATACRLAAAAGARFVKTCTGFAAAAATVEDIRLMRRTVGPGMGVKASGGIRALADALRLIEAGADRLGASAGVAIVT